MVCGPSSALPLICDDSQADGSLGLITEGRAKSLRLEEPDPHLFDSGKTYTDLKPSERLRRELQSRGIPWDEEFQRQGERQDKLSSSQQGR